MNKSDLQSLIPKARMLFHILIVCALLCVALEFGFEEAVIPVLGLHLVQFLAVLSFVATRAIDVLGAVRRLPALRRVAVDFLIIIVIVNLPAVSSTVGWSVALITATLYAGIIGASELGSAGFRRLYSSTADPRRKPKPGRAMLVSFSLMILLGGLLLCLPRATSPQISNQGGHYAWQRILNCFFTSTSATCVTGLVVYDTGHDFTRFGQCVILVLIQLGGLGIMIFGSIFGLLLRRQLSLRESLVLQDIYSQNTVGQIRTLAKFICVSTLLIEAGGTLCLYGMWGPEISAPLERWFYSVFHAVSAFCNAGFSLQDDSLISYGGHWQVYGAIMPAIVLGGLGFPVLADIGRFLTRTVGTVFKRLTRYRQGALRGPGSPAPRLHLHSKLVLCMTVVLVVLPAIALFFFETINDAQQSASAMSAMSPGSRALAALFQSVTCRTAGFNTASTALNDMSTSALFLMSILMFIGGSPASTAGGVKTVAIAVLVLGVVSALRNREQIDVFRRQIPLRTVRQAAVVIILMFALVSGVVLVLSCTESAQLAELLFEAMSACGTVGLSTGLTPHLTITGKLVIMLAMLAGRLGPLTLLIALAGREQARGFSYPTEHITIG